MEGWVRFHRKIEEWEWYTDPNVFRLFFHLVMKANHEDGVWRGQEVKRGQHITSIRKLGEALDLSDKQIRLAIDKLKRTNEIATKGTNKNTVVTVVNYGLYQDKEQKKGEQKGKPKGSQKTNKGQSKGNKQEEEECKKEKKIHYDEFVLMTESEYFKLTEKFGSADTLNKIQNLNNYIGSTGKTYKSHYHTILTWARNEEAKKSKSKLNIVQSKGGGAKTW